MTDRGPLLRTLAFLVASLLIATMVWRLLGGEQVPPAATYSAAFTDVSALKKGDMVKVAGVSVGRVQDVSVDARQKLGTVRFGVDRELVLTDRTRATIKFKNLTGDRYLALSQGIAPAARAAEGTDFDPVAAAAPGPLEQTRGKQMFEGEQIPVTRTSPALDLDALFGGFQPLFEALTPEQVNRLSGDLVQVLQGEGGTVFALLRDVADFTVTLADRNALIGQVVTNLNAVLATLTRNTPEFVRALNSAQQLVTGLAQQRQALSGGLVATAEMADQLSGTLRQARPELVATSAQLQRLGALMTSPGQSAAITKNLTALPKAYRTMAGFGSYGNWSNVYLCALGITFDGGPTPFVQLPEERCRL